MCAVVNQPHVISARFNRLLAAVCVVVMVTHAFDDQKTVDTCYFIRIRVTDSLNIIPKAQYDAHNHEKRNNNYYCKCRSAFDMSRDQVTEEDSCNCYGSKEEADCLDSCCRIP